MLLSMLAWQRCVVKLVQARAALCLSDPHCMHRHHLLHCCHTYGFLALPELVTVKGDKALALTSWL